MNCIRRSTYRTKTLILRIKIPINKCPSQTNILGLLRRDGMIDKCTFCIHRVKRGEQPYCVVSCPAVNEILEDMAWKLINAGVNGICLIDYLALKDFFKLMIHDDIPRENIALFCRLRKISFHFLNKANRIIQCLLCLLF
ncbi:MAG TPA: hypothetical protein DDX84_05480 [Nitrospiraceae bacterium]|nr:hypothetical protein [Nitrospiraceae bacterium]